MGETRVTGIQATLAAGLPDTARWIETRAMLRSPYSTVTGTTVGGGFVVRLMHGAVSAVAVAGRPPAETILSTVDGITPMTPLIAQTDNADYIEHVFLTESARRPDMQAWQRDRVVLHQIRAAAEAPALEPQAAIRLLTITDDLGHLPPGLRHEMIHAREIAPVGALFIDNLAVSFCYPCWRTESLWDISIDTLAGYRGRGFAWHVTRFMMSRLDREGLAPVWAALESNHTSLRLARRLGFCPVDENVVFSRGAWAFLSGGYNG
jgi:GNAT superfamily N-acetyltransferase